MIFGGSSLPGNMSCIFLFVQVLLRSMLVLVVAYRFEVADESCVFGSFYGRTFKR